MSLRVHTLSLLLVLAAVRPGETPLPASHAHLLNGTAVEFPADLHGKSAVLVLGFSQGARDEVTAWARRLAPDLRDSPTATYYEMAELESVPRLLRGWVTKRIKSSVPDRAQSHFVTLTDHEQDWRDAANYSAPDAAYILLVDKRGEVRWRSSGAASDSAYAELTARLHTLQSE